MPQAFQTVHELDEYSEESTTVTPGQYTRVYSKALEKGLADAFGRGRKSNQTDAEGRLFAKFVATGDGAGSAGDVIESGKMRITVRTRQGRLVAVINEFPLSEIQAGEAATDRGDRIPFPVQRFSANGKTQRWVSYPYSLHLEMKLPTGYDIDTSNSSLKADGYVAEKTE